MKWPVKKLGDICEIISGATPSTTVKEYWGDDFFWATPKDLSDLNDTEIKTTIRKISALGLKSCAATLLPINSVLFSSRAPIGLVAINAVPIATNQGFKNLVPNRNLLDTRYLYHWLTCNRKKIDAMGVGATFKEVSKAIVSKIEIPLPPLAEQQRIAALLDTADRILKQRESAIAKLDQLAQSVFMDMFSNCTNFESIKSVVLKQKITEPEDDQKVWSLSLDQIESDTGTLKDKVMVDFKKLSDSTFYFQPPVVLYSKLRPYLNKVFMPNDCGYATTELVPLYCNEKKVLPIYLLSVLRSKKFVDFANINSGGAKMPRVIMDKFWDYEFAVPSIQQQQKYVDYFNLILNQKRHSFISSKLSQTLLLSIQHQSFAVN